MNKTTSCPTCGSKVTVHAGSEGTSSYEPFPAEELLAVAAEAQRYLALEPNVSGRKLSAALAALDARLGEPR